MGLILHRCVKCGEDLKQKGNRFECDFCGSIYRDETAKEYAEQVRSIFGDALAEQKEEAIANCRKNLWRAVHAEHVSSADVLNCVRELKKLLPDDFQANFYEVATQGTARQINSFLNGIDVTRQGLFVETIADYLLRSLESLNVLPLKDLITRGLKGEKYTEYITKTEDEAVKLKEGLYSPQVPRDVFIAYSSKDQKAVNEIVEFLEENKISCFVALRNLRHGRGSAENYLNNLKIAMHNCRCVVFLSSDNSRDLDCDALKIELPYIKDNEPSMGRIEYLLTDYNRDTTYAAKRILENFFNGLEYCRTKEDLIDRILEYITGNFGKPTVADNVKQVKYCLNCGSENPTVAKRCMECGGASFAEDYESYLRAKLEKEYAEKFKKQQEELNRVKAERRERERIENSRSADSDDLNDIDYAALSDKVKQYLKSAERGDASSQCYVGWCFDVGQGAPRNYKQAVKWYSKAAAQGNATAQYNLGYCYKNGQGVPQDHKEAVRLYLKAAEQGNSNAQYGLGNCYKNGQGVQQDYKEALRWYLKAAEQNNVNAQYAVGYCYKNGQGVQQDYKEALKWYRKAADNGDSNAQYAIGYSYNNGQGVQQDYKEALIWYRKAAEQGDSKAQYAIGYSYKNGLGVLQDYEVALMWYRKAADQGYANAQYAVGVCYHNGQGVKQDYDEAVRWYRKAANQGYESAIQILKKLGNKKNF